MKKQVPIARYAWAVMKITVLQVCLLVALTGAGLAASPSTMGQGVLDKVVTIRVQGRTLSEVLTEIEQQSQVRFSFNPKSIPSQAKITLDYENASLRQVLDEIATRVKISYEVSGEYILLTRIKTSQLNLSEPRAMAVAVTGVVNDDEGHSLPGVNVIEKGTTNGTATDAGGKFSLQVAGESSVLVFTFIGFQTQEVSVGSTTNFSIALSPDVQALDEVVVVGYGTVKKSDLTGAVAKVKSEDITAFPTTNVVQALSGRAPGVQVIQNTGAPGANVSVRIRGTNSIQGSNEPLYVVDGFPISGSNPSMLNNADIESMEILKDASATAIYGSRGANGVVLITTKRGSAGRTRVDLETSFSMQSLRKKMDLMNGSEYAQFVNETRANDNLPPYFTQQQIAEFGDGTDWQDLVFQTAPMYSTTLSVTGGTEKTRFSVSGSSFNQEGIIVGSDYNRYALRSNLTHDISSKFKIELSTLLSRIQSNTKNSGGGNRGGSLIGSTISAPPTLSPYNEDGSYTNMVTAYPFISNSMTNPLNHLYDRDDKSLANTILANTALSYKITPDLTVRLMGGIENTDSRADSYTSLKFVGSQGSGSVSTTQYTSLLSEGTVTYQKKFADVHNISAVAGYTFQNFVSTMLSGSGVGFLSDATGSYELESAATPGIPNSGYTKSVLQSFLGRVHYSYADRYLFTASARADGSSKYSPGNKWGFFPSAAVAWRVSNESFFSSDSFISDLKARASWGVTGSQAIDAYATLNQLYAGKTTFDKTSYTTYAPGTRLPGDLRWETTEQIDFGADIGLFQNRFLVTLDYYIKNTRDLLNTVVLPPTSGFTSTIQNVGQIQNKGFEFSVDGVLIDRAVKWRAAANVSINRNKVTKLYDGEDILGGSIDVNAVQDYTNILREGRPVGQFWGYSEDGYTEAGQIKYMDTDGDGAITVADKTYTGDPNPDFIFGFNTSVSYRNFELSVFFQGVQGNDLLNISSINSTLDYGIGLNMPREVFLNHWTAENTNAKYPKPSISTRTSISDRFVEDGSYVRMRNIQLAYSLPVQKLEITWLRNLQLYVSGQNLLTLTNYSWWDPEVNSQGGASSVNQGLDYFTYPTARSVTIGLRAGL